MIGMANLSPSAGARLRAALEAEHPLQIVGAITAYAARMAQATGFRALYLSGGGVAANSLGMPDLGISTMDDVLIDIRRLTEASTLPLLVDADTGWGGAFNIARTVRSFTKAGAAGLHIEDQVAAKRCGHRPGKEIVGLDEMVDRIKAAVDARTDSAFVILCRSRCRHDFSGSDDRPVHVSAVQSGRAGADPGQHHRVWPYTFVHA
jgi:methylisocitrate lyase